MPRFCCILDSLEFEDVFSLLVVVGDFAGGLAEADGNFSMVGDAVRCALVVLVESQTSLPQQAVHILPRSAHKNPVALIITSMWLMVIFISVKYIICCLSLHLSLSSSLFLSLSLHLSVALSLMLFNLYLFSLLSMYLSLFFSRPLVLAFSLYFSLSLSLFLYYYLHLSLVLSFSLPL